MRKRFELTDEEMRAFYWEGTQERNEDGSSKFSFEELAQYKLEFWQEIAKKKGFDLSTMRFTGKMGVQQFTAEPSTD